MGRLEVLSSEFLGRVEPIMSTLGNVFADAFAKYTVEVLALAKERNLVKPEAGPGDSCEQVNLDDLPAWIQQRRTVRSGEAVPPVGEDEAKCLGARSVIVAQLRAKHMTQADLARKLKMKPSSLSRILQEPQKSRVATLQRIASALDLELRDLF